MPNDKNPPKRQDLNSEPKITLTPVSPDQLPSTYSGTYHQPYYYGTSTYGSNTLEAMLGDLSLGRMLRIAKSRWPTIVLVMIFAMTVAGYYLYKATPIYRGSAIIEMTVRRPRIMGDKGAVLVEDRMSQTEEFNTRLEKFKGKRMIQLAGKCYTELSGAPELNAEETKNALGAVEFELIPESRLVRITVDHENPQVAAAVANAYAKAAEEMAIQENRSVSDSAVSWLKSQAGAQREALNKADQAIVDFSKKNNIAALKNKATGMRESISALNEDLVEAENEHIQARNILEAIKNTPHDAESLGQLPSAVPRLEEINEMVQKWSDAVQEKNALLVRYTPQHPQVIAQSERISGLAKQLDKAIRRAQETAAADVEMARQKVQTIKNRIDELSDDLSETQLTIVKLEAHLDSLKRERDAAEVAFGGILNRMEEARLAADEETATIQIAEMAGIPVKPVSPKTLQIIGIALFLGIGGGAGLALVQDVADDHVTEPAEIEMGLGVDILGAIPNLQNGQDEKDLDLTCLRHKDSHTAELFAGIRSDLDLAQQEDNCTSLVISSSEPQEGKTFTATNLAIMYARAGRRTLLVDFDLRRPRLQKIFDISDEHPSLLHTLAQCDAEKFPSLPARTQCDNLEVISTRPDTSLSTLEVLGNPFLGEFFAWAESNYDQVIIDSPPLGVLADSVTLSGLCQGIILVCQPNKSRRTAMGQIVRRFQKANGNILGVVFNNFKFSQSKFKNYSYYHGYSA